MLLAWALAALPAIAQAADEHLVAVVATRGSVHQPFGEEIVVGATAEAERLNRNGGVLGASIRLVTWQEDCSRERAIEVAEEIVRLKPAVVIGHLCAGAALAAAPIYAAAGVLMIAPGVRHPSLTRPDVAKGLVLRLAGRDDRFATDTVTFIRSRKLWKSVAVIADRTRQARSMADGIASEARHRQLPIALDVRIESGEKSYAGLVQRVKRSGAGVIVMPAQPIELGVVAGNLRRAGVEAPIVGSEILAVPAIRATAEAEKDRLVLMLPWTGLERVGGVGAMPLPLHGASEPSRRRAEAALEVWAALAKLAGSAAASAVAGAARTNSVATAVGPLRFDDRGDALVPSYVPSTWRGGRWQPVDD